MIHNWIPFHLFCTCLFTCSHHMFWKFSGICICLYKTLAIFPWFDNSVSKSIYLILLKMMPNLLFIKSFSSAIVLTAPDCAKLVKYCCNNLSDLAFSPFVLLTDNSSSTTSAVTFWTWICSTTGEAALLLSPPWTLAWSFITCGDKLLGEGTGEAVCYALEHFKSFVKDVLCCLDGCLVTISFVVNGLAVGGLAALLMLDPCLLLEEASLLILSRTSVNCHNILAVDGLDAGCFLCSKSFESFFFFMIIFTFVWMCCWAFFLEEAAFLMLVFVEKRI